MKKYKTIDGNHQAGIEIDGNQVLIWLEIKKKSWFGSHFERCTLPVLYHLIEGKDRLGCTIDGGFLDRIMYLQDNERNIDTFDVDTEISKLYHEYMENINTQNRIDKKLSQFTNSL